MLRPEMNRASQSRRLAVILAAACWPGLAMGQITSVVNQNNGTLGIGYQDLSMISAGVLAFDASTETSNQRGVFSFDPTTSTLTNFALATTNSTTNTVIRDITRIDINDAGTVAFQVTFGGSSTSNRPQGVYSTAGAGSVLVVKSGATTSINAPFALNNANSLYGIDDVGRSYLSIRSNASPSAYNVARGNGLGTVAALIDNLTNYPNVQGGSFLTLSSGAINSTTPPACLRSTAR